MPAYEEEIEEAEHEGVALRLLTAPVEVRGRGPPRGGHQVPAHAAGRVRPLRPPPARRRRRGLRHPGRPRAGGHRPDAGPARRSATASHLETRNDDFIAGQPGHRPDLGEVDLRRRRRGDAAPPRWSRRWRPASGRPWASTCTSPARNHAFWRETKEVDTSFDPDAEPVRYAAREAGPDPRRAAAQQLRRSRAALARGGGRPPGQPLPALRLRQALASVPR